MAARKGVAPPSVSPARSENSQSSNNQSSFDLLPDALEELQASLEELRTAEEELRQQNDALADARLGLETERSRYHSLFEFAPDAYLVSDLQGIIQEANRASSQLLGVSSRYLVGKPLGSFVAEEARRAFRLSLLGAEHLEAPQTWKTRLRRRHHGEFDAEITIGLISGRENRPAGLRWLVRDITTRHLTEEQSSRRIAELEQMLATRNQELEQAFTREHDILGSAQRTQEQLQTAYQRERAIAQTLQNSLLRTTRPSALPGLHMATLYKPASDEAQVGGDFFDAFTIDNGKVALVVGDISGKGLAAAACTAEVKYALRAFLRQQPDAALALSRLNDFFCDARRQSDWERDIFATLALALVDPADGSAFFAAAGAEPPLLWRAGGEIEIVETRGLLLGVESNQTYPQFERQMAPNDTLLLLTDGITEARRNREFFGLEGVSAVLQNAGPEQSLDEVGAAILSAAREYAGGTFQDDVCLLMACREEKQGEEKQGEEK